MGKLNKYWICPTESKQPIGLPSLTTQRHIQYIRNDEGKKALLVHWHGGYPIVKPTWVLGITIHMSEQRLSGAKKPRLPFLGLKYLYTYSTYYIFYYI
jgi:sulfatase maturation enzyme AslB (radical SAM superfamily)